MLPDIPDEGRLVLCCARTTVDSKSVERAEKLVEKDLDWALVKQFATANQVVPLFYNGLLKSCPETVPAAFLKDLGELASTYADRNQTTSNLLLEILDLLESNGMPAVPFKGIVFTLAHYGDLKLRQCGDIDILVRRQDFLGAKDLLIRNGFSQIYFGHHEAATAQAQLLRKEDKETVDLHYGITPHYYPNLPDAEGGSQLEKADWNKRVGNLTYWHFFLDPEPLWNRLVTVNLSGRTVSAFSPEDTLIVASIQGVKDLWLSLRRICDVAEVLRANPSLDWDLVLSQVHELNFEKKFCLGIQLAHHFLGAPVDERVLQKVRMHPVVCGLAAQTCTLLFKKNDEFDRLGFRLSSTILTMDTVRDRLRYFSFIVHKLRVKNRLRPSLRGYRSFLQMLSVPFILMFRRTFL